jgi:hypothetical protein
MTNAWSQLTTGGGGQVNEKGSRVDLPAMLLTLLYSSEGVALSVIIVFVYVAFRGARKLTGAWRKAGSRRDTPSRRRSACPPDAGDTGRAGRDGGASGAQAA